MTYPANDKKFGKLRSLFWPIHSYELKKLIPMLLMFFFISFAYSTLKNMKDAFIVTAVDSGAEAIPFVKVWVMLPGAIILTALFMKLSNHFDRSKVFYVMITIFLVFFALFAFVIYPYREHLHLHKTANFLQGVLPLGLKGFVAIVRYWSFAIFYAMAELWSSVLLSLLFWGFANDIMKMNEAKRFYGLLAIGANSASIFSGQLSHYLSRHEYNPALHFGEDAWGQSVTMLTIVIIGCGIAVIGIFKWINVYVLTDTRFYTPQQKEDNAKLPKVKMSLKENFAYLAKSKYLICLAIIVITYNLIINLVEVVWKAQILELHPNPGDYNAYMSQITTLTGIIATIIALFISGNTLRKKGWTFTALITPFILLVTTILFFGALIFKESFTGVIAIAAGSSPIIIISLFGSAQNILSRSSKFTVFDATKEMAFIPLSRESRLKGKSSIDGIASRFGKSGGSVIHQVLLMIFGSLALSAPYVGIIVIFFIIVWIFATNVMGKEVSALTSDLEAEEINREHIIITTNNEIIPSKAVI